MPAEKIENPYRMRLNYLSSAEMAFFHVLTDLVKGRFFVCPKVALSDLFFVARPNENVQYANKLLRKNVDFLLIWADSLQPALAMELDYPKQLAHRPVDEFLESIFESVGIPLIHVLSKQPYDIVQLSEKIQTAARKSKTTVPHQSDYSPICPRCGITMVLRFGKDGPFANNKFYGCLNFPECVETISVD